MITLFAIAAALLSFWGYRQIKDAMIGAANEAGAAAARSVSEKYFSGDGFKDTLKMMMAPPVESASGDVGELGEVYPENHLG